MFCEVNIGNKYSLKMKIGYLWWEIEIFFSNLSFIQKKIGILHLQI